MSKNQYHIRLNEELGNQVEAKAKLEKVSFNELINTAVKTYLNQDIMIDHNILESLSFLSRKIQHLESLINVMYAEFKYERIWDFAINLDKLNSWIPSAEARAKMRMTDEQFLSIAENSVNERLRNAKERWRTIYDNNLKEEMANNPKDILRKDMINLLIDMEAEEQEN